MRKSIVFCVLLPLTCISLSCTSYLREAKFYYVQAQEFSRSYKTETAIGSYKKSLEEAEKEVAKRPSSQAHAQGSLSPPFRQARPGPYGAGGFLAGRDGPDRVRSGCKHDQAHCAPLNTTVKNGLV